MHLERAVLKSHTFPNHIPKMHHLSPLQSLFSASGLKVRLTWLCLLGYILLLLHPLLGHIIELSPGPAQGILAEATLQRDAAPAQPELSQAGALSRECSLCLQVGSLMHGATGFKAPSFIALNQHRVELFSPVMNTGEIPGIGQPRAPPVI